MEVLRNKHSKEWVEWAKLATTITRKDMDRFLEAFGTANRSELVRNLVLKAIEEKEEENKKLVKNAG
jgi:metal-responsive CopG/Arc/MetJ family transcriptional regulator